MPDGNGTAKVRLDDGGLTRWLDGEPVLAEGSDVVVGTILHTGTDDDGPYALVMLTDEARGIAAEEDPFG